MSEKFTETQLKAIHEILVKIVTRAAQDEEFRKVCLSDPSAAFKEVMGKPLPSGAKIKFAEPGQGDPSNGIYELPPLQSGKLSDEDLEKVAGGAQSSSANVAVVITTNVNEPTEVIQVVYAAPVEWQVVVCSAT